MLVTDAGAGGPVLKPLNRTASALHLKQLR